MARPHLGDGSAATRWAAVVVVLQFLVLGILHPILKPYVYSDFATFHAAARCFGAGGNPYDVAALRAAGAPEWQGWTGRYFYPPPFAAAVLRPWASLPFDAARRAWAAMEALAYITAVFVLGRRVLPDPRRSGLVLGLVLAASFAPMAFDLHLGSVSGILLLLTSGALVFRSQGHEWRAALCLAAAVLLKLVPAAIAVVWLVRREWRLMARTAVMMAGLLAAALPWTGIAPYRWYVRDALPALAHETFTWFTNQSLDAALGRVLTTNPDTTPWIAAPGLHRVLTAALAALLAGATAWMIHRTRRTPRGGVADWWTATAALAVAPLFVRVAWEYLVVLALPFFFVCAARIARAELGRRCTATAVGAWVACAWPWPYFDAPFRTGAGLLLEAPRTLGLILVLLTAVLATRRNSVSSS